MCLKLKWNPILKNGKETEYKRTARVEKNEKVSDIVQKFKVSGDSYLRHRSHVTNIDTVLSIPREIFTGVYIELDISENLSIKSDNAPTQYKKRYAFESLQELANEFNLTIVRIYGAAGHGKGLIDSMSSFGCKSILRRMFGSQQVNIFIIISQFVGR